MNLLPAAGIVVAAGALLLPLAPVPAPAAPAPAATSRHAAAHEVAPAAAADPGAPPGRPPTRGATSGTAPPEQLPAQLPAQARGGWAWPLSPRPPVLRRFAVGPDPWSPGHRGVDLGAAAGATVRAPAAGRVTFAGVVVDRPVLVVTHANGLRTSYEPVTATAPVGTVVTRGDPVGTLATGGHCHRCLHWGARNGGRYIDPLLLLGPTRVVLLPLGSGG